PAVRRRRKPHGLARQLRASVRTTRPACRDPRPVDRLGRALGAGRRQGSRASNSFRSSGRTVLRLTQAMPRSAVLHAVMPALALALVLVLVLVLESGFSLRA